MALIVLDRQHAGVPSRDFRDLGAWADLDGDGAKGVHETEAMLTPQYALAAEQRLGELGHQVVCISDGSYSARHERAKTYKADVYIACHLNAGGGRYGLVVYDHRSQAGAVLAGTVAAALGRLCPELTSVRAEAGSPSAWTNAYNTISGVQSGRPVGLCYEPAFIDHPQHRELLRPEGLRRLGLALADGIHAYCKQRGL